MREGACLELPHIMILIDDPDRRIIEPLFEKTGSFSKLYDTDLMQNGGHITGWFIPQGKDTDAIESGLEALCDRETFNAKYGCTDAQALLPYAVGDGNHSMATAKAYWEEVKKGLSPEEQENHPGSLCARGDRQHPRREHHHRADPPRTVRRRRRGAAEVSHRVL